MAKQKPVSWQEYEDLIYRIYTELEPLGTVTKNDHIAVYNSTETREIDISVKIIVGAHEILLVIEAKNHKRPVTRPVIDAFATVIKDVRAAKGIIISNSGFTKSMKENAKKHGIDLMSAHDASNKDWTTEIQVPVIKRSVKVSLTLQHHYVPMKEMAVDGVEVPYPERAIEEFVRRWENDTLDKTPGIHYLELDKDMLKLHTDLWALQSGIKYEISHRYHFKYFVPVDYRGLRDYITKRFTPTFMQFDENIPFLNDGTWKYIESPSVIAVEPIMLDIEMVDINFLRRKLIRFNWKA